VEFLNEDAARALLAASQNGTKILVTGAVVGDPYGQVSLALQKLGIVDAGQPVRLREATGVTFDRNLQESLLRSVAPPLESFAGNIWHEPLPLDHAREDEPLRSGAERGRRGDAPFPQRRLSPTSLRTARRTGHSRQRDNY
jgi:hypothetical protein